MAVYMIAYELHEGEDYEGDLIKAIKALPSGGSWHNLGSTWFVISEEAAVQIHNSLKRHVLDGISLPWFSAAIGVRGRASTMRRRNGSRMP
jgi:hypothetical protein